MVGRGLGRRPAPTGENGREIGGCAATIDTEQVPASDPRSGIVSVDAERMSGTPCFAGTRVPVKTLWDYLEGGGTLEEFLDDFQGVTREKAIGALELAFYRLIEGSGRS